MKIEEENKMVIKIQDLIMKIIEMIDGNMNNCFYSNDNGWIVMKVR